MISDERQNIRELGLRRILKARLEKSSTLRQFKIPKLNFDAGKYFDLIDWRNKLNNSKRTTPDRKRNRRWYSTARGNAWRLNCCVW